MNTLSATELKTGKIFKESGQPYQVVRYSHIKSARGGATVRVKAKNLITGYVAEKTYDSSTSVEDADITRSTGQFLYKNGSNYYFMDSTTFEQITLTADQLGEGAQFLTDGESVVILYFDDNAISADLPISVVLEVAYTEPGFKGNTVSNVLKDATLSNGAVVKVPTFIKQGNFVKIDTRTGAYISKG